MKKIRKGDQVVVIAGRDKGRRGAVIQVLGDDRVRRRGPQHGQEAPAAEPAGRRAGRHHRAGGAAARRRTLRSVNPATQKGDRVGFKALADGRKVRFFKSNSEMIDAK